MSNSVEANTTDTKIVDEIIHYLKLNNAGHIDRDNVVDVLVKSIDDKKESDVDELDEIKDSIRGIISDLEDLV